MTKEYTMIVKRAGTDISWEEKIDMQDGVDPAEYAKAIVDGFNEVERARKEQSPSYPMDIREFVAIKNDTGVRYCDVSHKVNAMTILKREMMYDVWQCTKCKLYYQRSTLATPPKQVCAPERTCRECNKVFKTVKLYQNHMAKNKHREPWWLPDGV